MKSDRLYLYVPPEEKGEVQALGASWDAESSCWYIGAGDDRARFWEWLPEPGQGPGDEEFSITSEAAYVAAATVACWKCRSRIEVICIYCESGTVLGEPLSQFTVSSIRAIDGTLARRLAPWPTFREVHSEVDQESHFANHCPHCGALQEDMHLHSEPGHPFFSIPRSAPGAVRLTALEGRVRLSGDESFEV
ncbi:MAG: hypothetical protein E6K23_16870 [Gammaproteobacteria bacterium]|nr:MAG: hypothetical protein E6K23_16870 [Gammaproteobacteria bacterium]